MGKSNFPVRWLHLIVGPREMNILFHDIGLVLFPLSAPEKYQCLLCFRSFTPDLFLLPEMFPLPCNIHMCVHAHAYTYMHTCVPSLFFCLASSLRSQMSFWEAFFDILDSTCPSLHSPCGPHVSNFECASPWLLVYIRVPGWPERAVEAVTSPYLWSPPHASPHLAQGWAFTNHKMPFVVYAWITYSFLQFPCRGGLRYKESTCTTADTVLIPV